MTFAAAEADRMIANLVRLGRVVSVDTAAPSAVVDFGDITSPALPVAQMRAGTMSFWWLPSVGEQVLVACPGGDIAQGVILGAIFAGNAPSSNAAEPMIDLAGGRMVINGDLQINGDVEINGTLRVSGVITSDVDVIAAGISLVSHVHPHGDPAGITGAPQ